MKDNKSVLEVIEESTTYRERAYINYFYKNIVNITKEEPVYNEIDKIKNAYISIVKDSTSRILNNANGKLMERSWRNSIFYFIDKKTFIKYFGTNSKYPNASIINEQIQYDNEFNSSNTNKPNEPRTNWKIIEGIQMTMFNKFKEEHSSWFVRSYVYFILVVCDKNSDIKQSDFHIYYWNTNYAFKKIKSKQSIFNNVANSYFVKNIKNEIVRIEDTNKDVIDCVNAYNNNFDFLNETEENYADISKDIDNGVNFILVQGAARTGKTIIAMRILGNYKESKLLLMNYYFYIALKDSFKILNVEFPITRIYHHDLAHNEGCWVCNKKTKAITPKLDFLIVDEAQRLALLKEYINYAEGYTLKGLDQIDRIINNNEQKHTIFLGDDFQKINPIFDQGFNRIYKEIKDKNFREYRFKNSIGVPPKILENIKTMLNVDNTSKLQPSDNFRFSISNSPDIFIKSFEKDKISKKHYLSIGLKPMTNQKINSRNTQIIEYPKKLKDNDYPYFFDEEIKNKYLLTTYQVISREIESVYLYIPNSITHNKEKNQITFKDSEYYYLNNFLINHLYTLMTRATMKLHIFCEDEFLYEYFKNKIDNINLLNLDTYNANKSSNAEADINNNNLLLFDYDVFLAYHGTNSPNGSYNKAKEICDQLKTQGYSIFLNDYSCSEEDDDIGFDETTNVIQRAKNFILVINDSIPRDSHGMIPRKYKDKNPNQLYKELKMFGGLVDSDLRSFKRNFKVYYDGSTYNRVTIYNFINSLYREGTWGNSNCCYFEFEEIINFLKNK